MIEDLLGGLTCDERVFVSFICGMVVTVVLGLFLHYVSRHL
jgi:hypothetical protein